MRTFFLLFVLIVMASPSYAGEAKPNSKNPIIEARMLALSEELRCVVCQNESLAGSQAPLAADLRQEIREMMEAGMSDHQIVDFFVERYGDFVLYNPPFKPLNYPLWFGIPILLILAFTILFFTLRKRRASAAVSLSLEDHRRATELLGDGEHR